MILHGNQFDAVVVVATVELITEYATDVVDDGVASVSVLFIDFVRSAVVALTFFDGIFVDLISSGAMKIPNDESKKLNKLSIVEFVFEFD